MNAQLSWTAFLKYVGSVQHMQEFQTDLSAHAEPLVGAEFKGVESNITFSAVSFQYHPHQLVLDEITLIIPKNKTIAVVGKSGSGKTTLLNILTGLLSPTAGQITVDGLPLSSFNRDSYRSKIGLITQEVVVFSDSLYNNVTLWAPKNPANLTKFQHVLAQVDLLSFFTSHPLQEDVLLGDNGVVMSGGQRQRLAIARELYKDTSILLLDEATSALDTKTERFVQDRIDQIKGAMTLVIIAHRLSTIKSADLIVVLDEGKVIAQGNFKELMQTSSVFSSMVALQEM
jgi:subfamily B ATP-binding cassette protein MsbA